MPPRRQNDVDLKETDDKMIVFSWLQAIIACICWL
jgi:hypothetical protein